MPTTRFHSKSFLEPLRNDGFCFQHCVSLLERLRDNDDVNYGRSLHSFFSKSGFDRDAFVQNNMIRFYGDICGDLKSAHLLFDEIPEPSLISWTSLISSYVHHGQHVIVKRILEYIAFGTESELYDYIQGKNNYKQKIEMTAPVITQVSGSDKSSSFVVSFFVPKKNQAKPPPPLKGMHVQRWKKTVYVAVRQFGGFVNDTNVGEEAAALKNSIAGTQWSSAIDKSHKKGGGYASAYTVAQYNAPFEYADRVNEIWFLFDMQNRKGNMM
ncbi:heme-binding protein 2-like [Senna tora]|uniref:Heme-binding protein 2-like n=1 Tax=Senna tora TaxID=362788 RepID=A0A834X194_9FABA|nr:heme-binding protein 2-like [Senna tora]